MEQTAGKPGAGATTSEGKTLCFWAPANIICLYFTLPTHLYTLIFRGSGKLFQFVAKQENWRNGRSRAGILHNPGFLNEILGLFIANLGAWPILDMHTSSQTPD